MKYINIPFNTAKLKIRDAYFIIMRYIDLFILNQLWNYFFNNDFINTFNINRNKIKEMFNIYIRNLIIKTL